MGRRGQTRVMERRRRGRVGGDMGRCLARTFPNPRVRNVLDLGIYVGVRLSYWPTSEELYTALSNSKQSDLSFVELFPSYLEG